MTLGTLTIIIAVTALLLTLIAGFVFRKVKNWLLSYLQNFTGALFIVSGWVKAIDPLGTAFKLEQYFAEFHSTFEATWFSFLAPLFTGLKGYVNGLSVFMIVLEIVLGIMLVTGSARKLTAWAFLILVGFFTFLTGFTYLTGYVPEGVNFFQFAKWGPYVETNMKVTDCGCFGDFLVLKPGVSFLKDVFLLIPAVLFVIYHRKMHQIMSQTPRTFFVIVAAVGLTVYCFSNYLWDIPHTDFRPFKVGVNIAEQKTLEREAMENVEIIAYQLKNKSSGEVVELPFQKFLEEFNKYPAEEWEYEQIKSEPAIPSTKISDFEVTDVEGADVTEAILSDSNYSFMIVAYKLYDKPGKGLKVLKDSIFTIDTIRMPDTLYLEKKFVSVDTRQVSIDTIGWDTGYLELWMNKVNPVMSDAEKDGLKVFAVTSFADPAFIDDFRHATQSAYPFYTADDILLKTIVRSNPGILLLKNGEIIMKWHHKKFPGYQTIKEKYFQ